MISKSLVFRRLLCRGWTGPDTQVAEQGGHVGSEMFAVLWEPGGGGSSGLPDPRRLTASGCPARAWRWRTDRAVLSVAWPAQGRCWRAGQ
jgi:hypothetical protein